MSDKPAASETSRPPRPALQLLLGLLFGIAFGFLLQKGGVAKYHILMGVLLLEDFTVIKVMMSAIVVGMIGIHAMHYAGLVKLKLKPTRYAANALGGLIFGVGFGLSGYCPGTGAAALGQGNFDATAVMLGMLAGSYVYAEMSGWLSRTLNKVGDRGELLLPQLLHLPTGVVITLLASILVAILVAMRVM